jgi:hypothetical protein
VGREIQAISTINGFGTTLNGGVDVDNNKYNGAYVYCNVHVVSLHNCSRGHIMYVQYMLYI